MVSLRQTSLKYRGQKALTYDAIRTKQRRWHLENETIGRWLKEFKPGVVLDCPVGTGRFIETCADINVERYTGVDVSEEMIALARRKVPRRMKQHCEVLLVQGSATKIEAADKWYDVTVCVRFLDLIDEDAMRAVVTELARVTRHVMLVTIRLGDAYVPKSNTAEHDRRKFNALLKRVGFRVAETVRFREGSWHVLKLERV